MADDVQICNMGLARIQGEPIASLEPDEEGKAAALCRTLYVPLRDAVLRHHDWAWAAKRQVLSLLGAGSAYLSSYLYVYQLPADPYCLRPLVLLDCADDYQELDVPFEVEGRTLFTNLAAAGLKYTARITDPALFDDLFIDALAWRLAANMLRPLEGNSEADPWAMYLASITKAVGRDEVGKQQKETPPERWVERRFG